MITEFKNILFDDEDFVCCGSLFDNTAMKFEDGEGSMFYTINAIDGKIDHGYKEKETYDFLVPRRADINCSKFRNFMFEMDNVPLNDQMEILGGCGIRWSAVVYSGGKSYHAILSVEESLGGCHTKEGIDNYKNIWRRLSAKINEYAKSLGFGDVVDPSGKNPSRFTRYPGTIRDNGNEQKIMWVAGRMDNYNFNILLESCPRLFVSVVRSFNDLDVDSVEDFFEKAPKSLVTSVKFPINLAPSCMYPELLRLSLWAKDLGVEKELWLDVLSYRYFPSLLKIGYPEHKLQTAIDHAYRR